MCVCVCVCVRARKHSRCLNLHTPKSEKCLHQSATSHSLSTVCLPVLLVPAAIVKNNGSFRFTVYLPVPLVPTVTGTETAFLYFPICLLSPVPTVTGTEIAWFNFPVCMPVSGTDCNRYRDCLVESSCLFASPSSADCDWYSDCLVNFFCLFASSPGADCNWYRDCLVQFSCLLSPVPPVPGTETACYIFQSVCCLR